MRRRALLRAGATASLGVLGLGGTAAGDSGPSTAFEPAGHLDLKGATETVVSDDGKTAFVAVRDGYATVDLTDPTEPTLLAERRTLLADRDGGPLRKIHDVKVEGNRLLVVGPAHGMRDAISGVLVVDVSDPAAPAQIAFHETDYPIHNCFLHDGYAYLTANGEQGNPLVILDMEDGHEVARWSIFDHNDAWRDVSSVMRTLHDIWVQDGIAYLAYWDAGTWLLDVSTPTDPTYLTDFGGTDPATLAALDQTAADQESITPPGNSHYVTVNDDATVLGVGRETWAVDGGENSSVVGGPSGVDLYDITTSTDPELLATIEPPPSPNPTFDGIWTTAHNFEISGETLYTSWYQGGVKRHNISNPAEPVETSWWRAPTRTRFWTARQGIDEQFFVASSMGVNDAPAGIYTFPDRPGTQQNIPEPALTPTATPTPTDTATPTATPTPSPTTPSTTREKGPGFGILGTLGALGIGVWQRYRR